MVLCLGSLLPGIVITRLMSFLGEGPGPRGWYAAVTHQPGGGGGHPTGPAAQLCQTCRGPGSESLEGRQHVVPSGASERFSECRVGTGDWEGRRSLQRCSDPFQ